MAEVFFDRIKEQSFTTGPGPFNLAGAASGGFFTFASGTSIGNTCRYVAQNTATNQVEVGIGTLTSATTLARTSVESSSNGGALVNFSSGPLDIAMVLSATAWRSHHARHESGG